MEDCTNTVVAPKDKIHVLQIYLLINSNAEVSIHIKSTGITSQRLLPPPSCSELQLNITVNEACSLSPPRQIEIRSLELFSVVEEGLFSTTGYAGVHVAD